MIFGCYFSCCVLFCCWAFALFCLVVLLRTLSPSFWHFHFVQQDIRDSVLEAHCDNDDFHPSLTPLVLAAQRNNFGTVQVTMNTSISNSGLQLITNCRALIVDKVCFQVVHKLNFGPLNVFRLWSSVNQQLLVKLGTDIVEPSISLGGDVTLTQAVSTLHIYRALSQPAYILATQTDIFSYAFAMADKLQRLSLAWTDFGAELQQLSRRVQVFAGEMLGQSSSTEEVGWYTGPQWLQGSGIQISVKLYGKSYLTPQVPNRHNHGSMNQILYYVNFYFLVLRHGKAKPLL